jgi:hypothetical protein
MKTDVGGPVSAMHGMEQQMNPKRKAVLERIRRFEEVIAKGSEYLESGKHVPWSRLRALSTAKVRDGKELPPHRDWVKNVFLPRLQKALRHTKEILEKLDPPKTMGRESY